MFQVLKLEFVNISPKAQSTQSRLTVVAVFAVCAWRADAVPCFGVTFPRVEALRTELVTVVGLIPSPSRTP